jgi:hypothetical protein
MQVNRPAVYAMVSTLLLVACSLTATAQLQLVPLAPAKKKATSPLRTYETPLNLPFWDDFSFSFGNPADSLWEESENVWVNRTMGIHPPTLGVASLDGADERGNPYNPELYIDGRTDKLQSRPIDLSNLSLADQTSVYLSFFYQFKGHGEAPDSNDSIWVEIKDVNGLWRRLWPLQADAPYNKTGTEFEQVIRQISDPAFFHDSFQFRFQAFGRQSGPYDTWNIDYVYLNKERNQFSTAYPDRAIATPLSSPFDTYKAMPLRHFLADPANRQVLPQLEIYNLNNNPVPQAMDYTTDIRLTTWVPDGEDTLVNTLVATVEFERAVLPSLEPLTRQTVVTQELFDPGLIPAEAIGAEVDFRLFLKTDDNVGDYTPNFIPIDFRTNDTTSTVFALKDYYAYDDGTAEFGASLNQTGSQVAYLFHMKFDEPDTLVGVDIYWPVIGQSQAGQGLQLHVYSHLLTPTGNRLYSQNIAVSTPGALNQFTRYDFSRPVVVRDSFFIGWTQPINLDIAVGLDRNTDSGDQIYFNVDGPWEQNLLVRGSLMIRPRFGRGDGIIVGLPIMAEKPTWQIYPNPSQGRFIIRGQFDQIQVLDARGVPIAYQLQTYGDDSEVDISTATSGLYLLRLAKSGYIRTHKIIINK